MQGLLNKLEKELKLRNFSKRTIQSYIYETKNFLKFAKSKSLKTTQIYIQISQASIKNIKSPLDDI